MLNLYRGLREYTLNTRGFYRYDKHMDAYAEMNDIIEDTLEDRYGRLAKMLCRIIDRICR